MKLLLSLLIAIILGTLLSLYVKDDAGYVLMSFGQWSIETSLVLFAIILIVCGVVLQAILKYSYSFLSSPKRFKQWRHLKKEHAANSAIQKALLAQAEGNWKSAEKSLLTYVKDSDAPSANYLNAARAAQAQGNLSKRNQYLQLANDNSKGNDFSIKLTTAELFMSNQELEAAKELLQTLYREAPKNSRALELLYITYKRLNDWQSITEILPDIRSKKIFPLKQQNEIEYQVVENLLSSLSSSDDMITLHNTWHRIPKSLQHNQNLIALYARQLLARKKTEGLDKLLSDAIRRNWNNELVYLFGLTPSEHTNKQLEMGENWLRQHKNNATLLLTLGRLCMRLKLWGKARAYFESSLQLKPHMETYHALAQLLDILGEHDTATSYYRKGMDMLKIDEINTNCSYNFT
ncbi:MAG: hypothetical protein OEY38_18905 [Gammaproteobacteria bacterium]|nr:hypothetical protein [Gammaproteobacteria bacterium]